MRLAALVVTALTITTLGVACGGGSSPDTAKACTPGATQTCVGAGACSGGQTCKDDGSGYGACDCGGGSDSGVDAGGKDAAGDDTTPPPGDGPADTTTGPLSPATLSGLALWLDSDLGVTVNPDGTTVAVWADQSSNKNTAKGKCATTSGTTPCGPVVVKSDLKGHDAVHVGSVVGNERRVQIDDDPSLQFGTGPFCVIAVAKGSGQTNAVFLFGKKNGSSGLGVAMGNMIDVTAGAADAHVIVPGGYHLITVRGPALEIRLDGAATKGKTSTDDLTVPAGTPALVGMSAGGTGSENDVLLTELVVVKGAVTDAQVAGVEAYLKAKYKFTW